MSQATVTRVRPPVPLDRWPGTLPRPERSPQPIPQRPPASPPEPVEPVQEPPLATQPAVQVQAWRWQPGLIGAGLYLLAVLILLFKLGSFPEVAFNWEESTANGLFEFMAAPRLAHFASREGLMTDSGYSPLIVGPVSLSWWLGGISLLGLRLPIALLAAGAVPLCWRFSRRVVGDGPAIFAALLMAISPVFVLYGRTGTLVGLSLVPALLTAMLLLRVLNRPTPLRVGLLQVALISLGWAYGPIRFLWPIALAALTSEFLLRRGLRQRFAAALLITIVMLPLYLWGVAVWQIHDRADQKPVTAVAALRGYYNGRGEQVVAGDNALSHFAEIKAVVEKNATDSLYLLLDIDTKPAFADFWNPHGRLQPRLLVPFCLLGLGWTLWRARREQNARLLLLLFAGFWVPLLLTSNVHIGRLIYVVPLLALFTASGAEALARGVVRLCKAALTAFDCPALAGRGLALGLRCVGAVCLLMAAGLLGWQDTTREVPYVNMARGVGILQSSAPQLAATKSTAVVIISLSDRYGEGNTAITPLDPYTEMFAMDGYRLRLDRDYRFVNLAKTDGLIPPPDAGDLRPVLLYGGNPASALNLGGLCSAVYYTPPELAPALGLRTAALACPTPPTVMPLPR
jgi:4-amino-4-deoxy-L-arabinose transferase-like glycosyltransferase